MKRGTAPPCRPALPWALLPPMPIPWPAPGCTKASAWATSTPAAGPATRATLACKGATAAMLLPPAPSTWACTPCYPMLPGWAAWRVQVCPRCNCAARAKTPPRLPTKCVPPWPPCAAPGRCCSSTTIGAKRWKPGPTVYTWGKKTSMPCPPPPWPSCAPRACAWA